MEQRREEAQTTSAVEQGNLPVVTSLQATREEVKQWQERDPTLTKAWGLAQQGKTEPTVGEGAHFYLQDGLLFQHWHPRGKQGSDVQACEQLVLPKQCRSLVLRLAHDVPLAGHPGVAKTKDRVLQRYYWPGVFRDIAEYCRTCEVCQRSQTRKPARAPLVSMPLIHKPFQRIAMDLIGPLPKSKKGNRFILTICDYATRYPEAIPLPSTEAPRIVKELVLLFSRVGVPEEVLTDQGPNFMSALLSEVYRALQIRRIRTTPYHPQTDGLVECFNGTLKSMIKKFTSWNKQDWDEYMYLPYLLFAYREVLQESTGFSPFELLYGHGVRGPLDVILEGWTGERGGEMPVATHMVEMRDHLREMTDLVQVNVAKAQGRQRSHYDQGTTERAFSEGEQVLVLLPTKTNKLKLEWFGPYKVTQRVTLVDYEVETPGRRQQKKVYHVNLLKRWNPASDRAVTALLATLEEGHLDEPVDFEDPAEVEDPAYADLCLWDAGEGTETVDDSEIKSADLSAAQ